MMRAIGTDDSVNTCDCCGKTGLKYTVTFEDDDTGELVHFGSTCAKRNTGKTQQRIDAEIAQAKSERKALALRELRAHPAWSGYEVRQREARAAGVQPGTAWREFTRDAGDAWDAARREIAERYGLQTCELI